MSVLGLGASAVVTTATLISNAVGAAKNARDLAKGSSDSELKESVGAAYDALIDLKDRVLDQAEEIRLLKQQLTEREQFVGPVPPHGYVYAATDASQQRPMCPTCFQSSPRKIGFMGDALPWNGGIRRECKLCRVSIYEQPMKASQRSVHRNPMFREFP